MREVAEKARKGLAPVPNPAIFRASFDGWTTLAMQRATH